MFPSLVLGSGGRLFCIPLAVPPADGERSSERPYSVLGTGACSALRFDLVKLLCDDPRHMRSHKIGRRRRSGKVQFQRNGEKNY